METKAKARRLRLVALARLVAQARLNAGDALSLGRTGEAAAWGDVSSFLEDVARSWANETPVYVQAMLEPAPEKAASG